MTRSQLDRTVARRTGVPLRAVRRLGSQAQAGPPPDLEPEGLGLALACPSCGHAVAYPGVAGVGSPALAGCDRCDDFGFDPDEVQAAPGTDR